MTSANQEILDRERQMAVLVEVKKMNVTLYLILNELKKANQARCELKIQE